jgi:hypothetical protein
MVGMLRKEVSAVSRSSSPLELALGKHTSSRSKEEPHSAGRSGT